MTRKRAEEYRRLAEECLIAARRMSEGSDRDTLVRMAQVWERLAGEQQEADREHSEKPD
jgi:hypothetical protein